jgi:hypothetical protein
MPVPRFVVLPQDSGAFVVADTEYARFNMPERAVTINFAAFDRAQGVADALNEEWAAFVRNPW